MEKVTLGVETSLLPASVWVAENKGYFKEEGLDLIIKEFNSGKSSFWAMLEGEGVDISTVAPTPIMFSSFDRQDFYIFATFAYAYEDIKVIAHRGKGITTATDLRGKKIGTPAGTTGQFVTEAFLINNGLSSSEVEVIDISPSELPDALNNNRVDAIVIWEPHGYNAQNLLGQDAVRLPSSDIYRTTFNFMVMKDFAQVHPEVLNKFLRAIDKATDFIGKRKEESQAIVAERLKLDKELMTAIWDDVIMEIFLDQSLIVTMEAEARWAIRNKLTDKTDVPNYLDYIYYDALEEVKPEAIGIIR
ncbi:ABC transporter substrate-binding protein [Chloroflexota bacterium]